MYLGKVKWEKIQELRKTYLDGLPEGETRSAHINVKMLRQFLEEVEKHISSGNQYNKINENDLEDVGIVFYRGGLQKGNDWYEVLEDGRLQMNLAIVAKIGDEAIVLEPGGESTGLCPKNCGKL